MVIVTDAVEPLDGAVALEMRAFFDQHPLDRSPKLALMAQFKIVSQLSEVLHGRLRENVAECWILEQVPLIEDDLHEAYEDCLQHLKEAAHAALTKYLVCVECGVGRARSFEQDLLFS